MRWVIITVIISLLAAVGIWWWFAHQAAPNVSPIETGQGGFSLFGNLVNTAPRSPSQSAPIGEGGVPARPLGSMGLEEIAAVPVAGFGILPMGSTTIIRYVERETGHVFEARYPGGTPTRLSHTTIPRVHEASFSADLSLVMLRYLADDDRTIETFVAKIASTTPEGEGELVGSFLPENVVAASFAPAGSDVAYLTRSATGATLFIGKAGSAGKTLWSSPLREWRLAWTRGGILLSTAPSASTLGYAYLLAPDTKVVRQVVGGLSGLTASLSSDGKSVLYGNAALTLAIAKNGASASVGLRTLPDKCAWGGAAIFCAVPRTVAGGAYPDVWYQGTAGFADDLWRLATLSGTTDLVRAFNAPVPLDAIALAPTPDGASVFFMNKRDRSLWVAQVGEPQRSAVPAGD